MRGGSEVFCRHRVSEPSWSRSFSPTDSLTVTSGETLIQEPPLGLLPDSWPSYHVTDDKCSFFLGH